MKKSILFILVICGLNGCIQEHDHSASATAKTTAAEVQQTHQTTVKMLDQLSDQIPNETSTSAPVFTASVAASN